MISDSTEKVAVNMKNHRPLIDTINNDENSIEFEIFNKLKVLEPIYHYNRSERYDHRTL